MPIVYQLNGGIGPAVNLGAFINHVQHQNPPVAGPMPGQLPADPTTNLGPNQTHLQPIAAANSRTLIIGLITCAAVLYVSTDPAATAGIWLHHANAGHVAPGDVTAARLALGNPPWASILVIFGHPGPNDPGYTGSMATMIAQGVLGNNIIEIPNMIVAQLGANNLGFMGF
jgi:hypothetical protein